MNLKPIVPKPKNIEEDSRPACVGRALKTERMRLGMSQKEFGVAIGVCQQRVFRFEHDTGFPSLTRMIAIAKALDCSLDYLCGLTETRKPLPKN